MDIKKSLSYQKQSLRDGLVNETIPVLGQMNHHANMCTHAYYITLVLINSHIHINEQLYTLMLIQTCALIYLYSHMKNNIFLQLQGTYTHTHIDCPTHPHRHVCEHSHYHTPIFM